MARLLPLVIFLLYALPAALDFVLKWRIDHSSPVFTTLNLVVNRLHPYSS
jgi:hypothetical protein